MKRLAHFFIIPTVCGVLINSASISQTDNKVTTSAIVYPDSAGQSVTVNDLRLDFEFGGFGIYMPDNYPTVTYIPLETGERINFHSVNEVTFRGKRVTWKQYVEPDRRDEYDNIDENGYRHWTAVEVQTTVTDHQKNTIISRIDRPDYANVYLKGTTPRGEFKLQLNQENGKTVRLVLKPTSLLVCTKDSTHVYSNTDWNFCPICGGALK